MTVTTTHWKYWYLAYFRRPLWAIIRQFFLIPKKIRSRWVALRFKVITHKHSFCAYSEYSMFGANALNPRRMWSWHIRTRLQRDALGQGNVTSYMTAGAFKHLEAQKFHAVDCISGDSYQAYDHHKMTLWQTYTGLACFNASAFSAILTGWSFMHPRRSNSCLLPSIWGWRELCNCSYIFVFLSSRNYEPSKILSLLLFLLTRITAIRRTHDRTLFHSTDWFNINSHNSFHC